jgi:hypothetical protein
VFATSHGGVYSQFRRALEGRSFMQAWTLAGELPQVPLADGLALLLLARDVEPARFDRGVPRWHSRLCAERQLSIAEAQLRLAALDALRSAGAESAAEALARSAGGTGSNVKLGCSRGWLARD